MENRVWTHDNACIASGKLIAAGYTEGIDIGDDLYVLEGVEIEATSTTDYGIEQPQVVRTVQKRALVGNIEF